MSENAKPAAPSVCVLLPQYKHTNPLTLFSLGALIKTTERFQLRMEHGDAFIIHSRNRLASGFLESKCEWALWVDDDMVLPIGNADWFRAVTGFPKEIAPDECAGAHAINSLLAHGKPLVGALYYERRAGGRPIFEAGCNPQTGEATRAALVSREMRGLQPTKWVGTGCLLTHRSVFEEIQKKFPQLAPSPDSKEWQFFSPAPDPVIEHMRLAETAFDLGDAVAAEKAVRNAAMYSDRIWLSTGEDVTFCRRARACGFQPYVDCNMLCGHVGTAVYGP